MEPGSLLWLAGACLLAYFLKGFSGFGPALVLVPVVSLLHDPRTALTTSAIVDLVIGAGMLRALSFEPADRPLILRLAVLMALGSVAGAALAGSVPIALLLRIIAVVVLAFGVSLLVFHRPLPARPRPNAWRALDVACVAGGLSGGLVGVSGPFLVVFARPLMDKSRFRRILVALFLLESAVKLAAYAVVGLWTPSTPLVSAVALPAAVAGLLAGLRVHVRVGERLFSVVVGLILVALAVRLLTAG